MEEFNTDLKVYDMGTIKDNILTISEKVFRKERLKDIISIIHGEQDKIKAITFEKCEFEKDIVFESCNIRMELNFKNCSFSCIIGSQIVALI